MHAVLRASTTYILVEIKYIQDNGHSTTINFLIAISHMITDILCEQLKNYRLYCLCKCIGVPVP